MTKKSGLSHPLLAESLILTSYNLRQTARVNIFFLTIKKTCEIQNQCREDARQNIVDDTAQSAA